MCCILMYLLRLWSAIKIITRRDVYLPCRPWYTNVCTPPKDIVILVDTSAAMKWKKIKVAKTIAHLLVQGANQNDKVVSLIFKCIHNLNECSS